MNIDEADALLASYRSKFMKRHHCDVSPRQQEVLRSIAAKLDTKIKSLDKGNGCFIRLSTRRYARSQIRSVFFFRGLPDLIGIDFNSPKDAALAPNELIGKQMAKALRERQMRKLAASNIFCAGLPAQAFYDPETSLTLNDKLICLFEVFGSFLKIKSGEEALRLLEESERVYMDLLLLLDAIEGAKVKRDVSDEREPDLTFNMNYILRTWSDIPVGMEFRGFIFNVRKQESRVSFIYLFLSI